MLAPAPEVADIAIAMQTALFAAGMGRAVGVSDLQIAATALHHARLSGRPAVVVHYDADFEHLSRVVPELTTRWIVPRGSVG